jgi:two-component system sensor histidine kinase PhoQ
MRFFLNAAGQFIFQYSVIWENDSGQEQSLVFSVAEDSQSLINQVDSFSATLAYWLLVSGVLLVILQFIVLRWGLKPLRIIARDLEAIEQGKKTRLAGQYPSELQGLAANLNTLISSERAHMERYRNTLADLAHSLKTPLTILRGGLNSQTFPAELQQGFDTQITRMNEIVEYQLQRAAAKGKRQYTGKVDAVIVIKKIIASLTKVHLQKKIEYIVDAPEKYWVYCESGDLYEIIGNLLDNASKWCRQQVKVILTTGEVPGILLLTVEDDGPGIALEKIDSILQRGVRADENIQGHGIGMAVVNELVTLLGGHLSGGKSPSLGGMQWRVQLSFSA